jgi:hypothetical protein
MLIPQRRGQRLPMRALPRAGPSQEHDDGLGLARMTWGCGHEEFKRRWTGGVGTALRSGVEIPDTGRTEVKNSPGISSAAKGRMGGQKLNSWSVPSAAPQLRAGPRPLRFPGGNPREMDRVLPGERAGGRFPPWPFDGKNVKRRCVPRLEKSFTWSTNHLRRGFSAPNRLCSPPDALLLHWRSSTTQPKTDRSLRSKGRRMNPAPSLWRPRAHAHSATAEVPRAAAAANCGPVSLTATSST